MQDKPHFPVKKRRILGVDSSEKGNIFCQNEEIRSRTIMAFTTTSTKMEELIDQLRTLLAREARYTREDYIGCMSKSPDSILPAVSMNGGASTSTSKSSFTETLQSKEGNNEQQHTGGQPKKLLFGEHHRARLCEWAVEVVTYYSFPMYSVEVAMNILDRYLAKHIPSDERTMECLHLLTLTSLYLALKLITPQRPAPNVFVRLSRSKFTTSQMEETELKIMQGLGWLLNPPTAEEFARYYIQALAPVYPAEILHGMEEFTLTSIRTTLSDYMWIRYPPSAVAMGALSWSLHQVGIGSSLCYPSPLSELHRNGIYVHQIDSMQVLEYFYIRTMYSANEEVAVPPSAVLSRKRSAPGSAAGPRNSLSPVSIIKDNPIVIED
mmetsp:Transcript_13990/g.18237  ORF Transcript_13990/g.18237 Transcript_13990/m.18237 type:complete len:380 (+) Transcript_13990:128-1267(+)